MFSYLASSWQKLDPEWQSFLADNCQTELIKIDKELELLSIRETIYPPKEDIFRSLYNLPAEKIKVVILGQDPYHGENEANGLAFAVNPGITNPPSLRNIFKELMLEYNLPLKNLDSQLLDNWSKQGVLLLNTTLTVIKDQANSLSNIGWQKITDLIIQHVNNKSPHCVFMLWGNYARNKKNFINPNKHLILESVHPSPLSANRGFFGCNHFKSANQFLEKQQAPQISWVNNV